MTSKELREAAELILEWDGYIYPIDKPLESAAKKAAEHILATVRDDDDEPVSEEWAVSLPSAVRHEHGDSVSFLSGFSLFFGCNDHVNAILAQGIHLTRIKTRRQFRRLCEGLGIQLKETT